MNALVQSKNLKLLVSWLVGQSELIRHQISC